MGTRKTKGGMALLILCFLVCFTGCNVEETDLDPAARPGPSILPEIVLIVIIFLIIIYIYVKCIKGKKLTGKKILKPKGAENEVKGRISEIKERHSKIEVLGTKESTGTEIDVKTRISRLEAELANLKALVLEDPESRLKVAHLKKEIDLLKWLLGILIALAGIVIPIIIFWVKK